MEWTLPQRLETALASWPDWTLESKTEPHVIHLLKGGLTNRSYLVRCGASRVVLRLNNSRSERLGINRVRERLILERVAEKHLGPRLLYSDRDFRFSVFEYLPGTAWTRRDFASVSQRRRLAGVIDEYQALSFALPAFDYIAHLQRYWCHYRQTQSQSARKKQSAWRRFMQQLTWYQRYHRARKLVHHDLVPGNVIESGDGIKIIDWEYAALGYADLDLLTCKRSGLPTSKNSNSMPQQINYWLHELWWGMR